MNDLAVDTSALIALIFDEPESEKIEAALTESGTRYISVAALVELGIALASRTSGALSVTDVISATRLTVVAMDEIDAKLALEGWDQFGKGRHPARLNLGDCYSYALARRLNVPLLAIGDDFVRTDIAVLPDSEAASPTM